MKHKFATFRVSAVAQAVRRSYWVLPMVFLWTLAVLSDLAMGSQFSLQPIQNLVQPLTDPPGDAPQECLRSIISTNSFGSFTHYFGDFQSEYCRFQFDILYSTRDDLIPTQYPPAFYLVSFLLLLPRSLMVSFYLTMTVCAIAVLTTLRLTRPRFLKDKSLQLIAYFPLLMAFWRGNFGWIVGTCALAVWMKHLGKSQVVEVLALSLAISFKLALLPFALIYLAMRQLKIFVVLLGILVASNLIGGFIIMDTPREALELGRRLVFRGGHLGESPRFGIRFDMGPLLSILNNFFPSAFADELSTILSSMILFLCLVLVVLALRLYVLTDQKHRDDGIKLLLLLIGATSILITQPSYYYFFGILSGIIISGNVIQRLGGFMKIAMLPVLLDVKVLSAWFSNRVVERDFTWAGFQDSPSIGALFSTLCLVGFVIYVLVSLVNNLRRVAKNQKPLPCVVSSQ